MSWFEQLSVVLRDFYPSGGGQGIVGYLRGSADPKKWRNMASTRAEQMLILGSVPPTDAEWVAAGVAARGETQIIRLDDLDKFIITFGGFPGARPWGKISILTVQEFRDYGVTIAQFSAEVARNAAKKAARRASLANAMAEVIASITRLMEATSGEHKLEAGLLTGSQGNLSGALGYWANHLFNEDVPPLAIWNECFSELAHARSTLKERKFGEAVIGIIRARSALIEATGIYYRWKDGIQGAGTKMQFAIGAVAVVLIFSAAAAAAATAASAGAAGASAAGVGASEGTSAASTVTRLASLVSKADALATQAATSAGSAAPSMAAYEEALRLAEEGADELMEMVN